MRWTPPTWKSVVSSLSAEVYGLYLCLATPHRLLGVAFLVGGYLLLLAGVFVEGW